MMKRAIQITTVDKSTKKPTSRRKSDSETWVKLTKRKLRAKHEEDFVHVVRETGYTLEVNYYYPLKTAHKIVFFVLIIVSCFN